MNTDLGLDFRTTNSLWASVLVETLARSGVRFAVVSPGSRSTPLTLALARHGGIRSIPVLDERSAAFFALGLAKAGRRPVVLLCTSGTAGANYLPAVIEAHEGGAPLVVITADRPPEMRACASGQTIDQQKLFGGYVNFYHELAVPEVTEPLLRYLRQTIQHACERALLPAAGPVHLNAPFRDPLVPPPAGAQQPAAHGSVDWSRFFEHIPEATARTVPRETDVPALVPEIHGLIVVGNEASEAPAAYAGTIGRIATKLGWPVVTDGLSPARNVGALIPHIVTTADLILRNPTAAERLTPEVVLCIGGWPTSKVLRAWLEEADPLVHLYSRRPDNRDALHGRTQHRSDLEALAAALPTATAPNGYERLWAAYERQCRAALDETLAATTERFEGKAAWLMAQHLPEGTPLLVANSMPVRDVEYFWPANARKAVPFCNRGANGIDGTLSTALGIARASERPTVLLTGDLAFLHDTNGLLLASKSGAALTVVLINNRGGGIFEHLPVAQCEPPFEEFFATPQTVDFGRLCAAYDVEHAVVADWTQFVSLIATLPARGVRVLELRTDRKRDAATRKRLFAEIAARLR